MVHHRFGRLNFTHRRFILFFDRWRHVHIVFIISHLFSAFDLMILVQLWLSGWRCLFRLINNGIGHRIVDFFFLGLLRTALLGFSSNLMHKLLLGVVRLRRWFWVVQVDGGLVGVYTFFED